MHIILGTLSLLVLAVIPFLDAGESNVADLILSVAPPLILLGLFVTSRKHKPPQISKTLVWYVLLTFLWGFYSALNSISMIESAFSLWNEMSIFSFLLVAGSVLSQKTILPQVSRLFSLVAICLAIISFYFLLPGIKPYDVDVSFFYSTYGHNRLAEYLLLIFPLISIYLLVDSKKHFLGKLLWLTILVAFLLTFSRIGTALLVLTPFIAYFINRQVMNKYLSKKLIFIFVFLIGFSFISIFTGYQSRRESRSQPQNSKIIPLLTKPLSFISRAEYFRYTVKKSLERPLVGFGPGTYQYNTQARFAESKATSYAHNHLLERLYETGFPGLIIEAFFLIILFFRGYRLAKKTNSTYLLAAFVGVTLSFLHSMFDFGWQISAVRLTSLFLLLILQPGDQKGKVSILWISPLIIAPLLFLIFIGFNPVFNRDKYKQRIDYFDSKNNLNDSASLISSWKRVDRGNSQMYQYLSRRDLDLGDFNSATDNLLISYFAPLRNQEFPFDVASRIIDAYLSNPSRVDPERMFSLLEVISKGYSPHDFFWYPTLSYTGKIGLVVDDLTTRQDELEFSDSMKSLVNYWKFSFLLSKGEGVLEEIYPYIKSASRLDPENKTYRLMEETTSDLINPRMADLISKTNQIARVRFGDNQRADIYQFLLSLLYQNIAKLQIEDNRPEDAVASLRKAIEAMPFFGSSYVKLAIIYQRQGKEKEVALIVSDCQKIVDPNCLDWYLEEVANQPD